MSDQGSIRQGNWRLRRFVAYSILIHIGAGLAWGLPALLTRMAEQERLQDEIARAKNLMYEQAKAKEFARQQQIEQTRREIERELRKEFDKLAAALSEAKREELWKEVAKRTAEQSKNLAEALAKASTSEQDLRTLEAELQRAMIKNLDDIITAESARELADRFVDQVESQVAPGLAEAMKTELDQRVAQKMREEADRLIAKQREEAKRAGEQAKNALNEAAAKVAAASAADTQAGAQLAKAAASAQSAADAGKQLDQAKARLGDATAKAAGDAAATKDVQSATQAVTQANAQVAKAKGETDTQLAAATRELDQAAARLGEAAAKLAEAGQKAASLEGKAQAQVAASDQAIAAARAATAKASTAVQGRSPEAPAAVAAAQAATASAQAATASALQAVAGQADRGAVASADIRAAVESKLSVQVEHALTDELTRTTLPRLAGKLQESFKKQLDAAGMGDDALVAKVGKEVQERLAKAVPAMAKAGNAAVDARFGDLPPSDAGGAAAADAAARPGDSLLDKALAEGLAGMGESATKHVSEMAANASRDGALVAKATQGMSDAASSKKDGAAHDANASAAAKAAAQTAASDAAAMAGMRDSVGALARSAGNGRLNTSTSLAANVSALRQSSLARGRGARRDEAAYQEVTGQIAGRDGVQGERWTQQGARGAAAQAAEAEGARPARVVGRAVGEAKPSLANDKAYAPTFKTLAFASVPYCTVGFRIDGKLAKWDALPALDLRHEHGDDQSKQVLKLAWSNAGLFLYCKIVDPNRRLDKAELNNFWESDSVEVWLDAFNSKEKYRARHLGQQFWIWPDGSASDRTLTGGEAVSQGKGSGFRYVALHADQLERWYAPTPDGWVMEARVPPALITDADLAAGRILGFNAYINTMGGTDWYWSAGDKVATSVQPDTWGDLLLAGSDATIEVLPGQADKAKAVQAIGEPLRLRVTDPDMDLDPAARDKVMVTIKDGHGGQQNAVLEETAVGTGVFEGAVTTALALDQPVPAVLSVYEGERVIITYVDQARANGAREAVLSTSVTFGSAVTAARTSAR